MARLTGKNALICGDSRTINLNFGYDITGHTISFTVRTRATSSTSTADTDALIAKTTTSHSSPSTGVTSISLTGSDTRITPGIYVYDIQDDDGAGAISSTKVADIEFVADATKETT